MELLATRREDSFSGGNRRRAYPGVKCDLALFGQLDHVHPRGAYVAPAAGFRKCERRETIAAGT